MVRNAGKYGKAKRGGGRHFTSARVLSGKEEGEMGMWDDGEGEGSGSEEESESEEESSEEESDDEPPAQGSSYGPAPVASTTSNDEVVLDKLGNVVLSGTATEQSRQERKAAKAQAKAKAAPKKDESSDDDEAPLKVDNNAAQKSVKISDLSKKAPKQLSRREREEKAKKDAQEHYRKMHEAGKTDEAKSDLARLRKIREEREKLKLQRDAEASEKAKAAQAQLEVSGRRRAGK